MIRLLVVPLLFVASLAAGAEFSMLLPQQSSITFVSKQMNVPVEGSFRKFTAQISVDPAKPETGKASIELDLASIDTGNADADEEVAGKAWFDTKNSHVASFTSGSIAGIGNGRYEATGRMTIKGKTLDIKTPFTLRQTSGVLLIEGAFPLKRLDFNIGTGIWADTSVVADEVQIRFSLAVAAKK
ncbi:MAG TPA: YceI family protein [Gallionella sp.]|nr:YceI family protein [Gallionella sp.]